MIEYFGLSLTIFLYYRGLLKKIMVKRKTICRRLICVLLLALISFCFLISTSFSVRANSEDDALALLSGKTAGVMTGTPQDAIILAKIPDAQIQYFNSITDVALALEKNKVSFAGLPTVSYYTLVQEYPNLGYFDVPLAVYDIGTVFAKTAESDVLRLQMNEYIASLKESGKLEEMQDYWLFPHDWENVDIPQTGENGVLTMATTSTLKPFSFKLNNESVGYEIDIVAGFCREYGYGLKIEDVDFAGILSGITTGRYDLAACQISWTEERDKSVNFSDFYYTQTFVPLVNAEKFDTPLLITAEQETDNSSSDGGTENAFIKSIYRTLIEEDRWMTVLQGLLVTIIITAGGFALANLLGVAFCAMAMSRSKVLHVLSDIYSRLMQGLPIVVILMILYYIIFGKSDISNVLVAIMGFGLVFGAYMAQLFEGGISSVDKGQWEAALSTGLTKSQTFCGIILPQAVRTMLPGYFSNLISLMKGTAVVGYIAVNDLTKIGDIIRSNTYEAIVPLITIALIYFAIACLLLALMSLLRKKLAPKYLRKPVGGENQEGGIEA